MQASDAALQNAASATPDRSSYQTLDSDKFTVLDLKIGMDARSVHLHLRKMGYKQAYRENGYSWYNALGPKLRAMPMWRHRRTAKEVRFAGKAGDTVSVHYLPTPAGAVAVKIIYTYPQGDTADRLRQNFQLRYGNANCDGKWCFKGILSDEVQSMSLTKYLFADPNTRSLTIDGYDDILALKRASLQRSADKCNAVRFLAFEVDVDADLAVCDY